MRRRDVIGLAGGIMAATPLTAMAQAPQQPQPAPGRPSSRPNRVNPAKAIAQFVTEFDLAKVPAVVVDRARVAFVDTVGVMLAGSQLAAAGIVEGMIRAEGSTPAATIAGRRLRASPQLAGLANGVAAHAMDYDFTYFSGQSIAGLIPALLPVAEVTKASPKELLSAFIIGAEVCGRISRSAPTMSRVGGWHATGTVGTMSVAAGCARLMKAPLATIPDIMGITASLASGVTANFGSMTKPLHAGHAARDGIMAVQLGSKGFTASPVALEGPDGFFDNFARGLDWQLGPFIEFGYKWDLADYGYKIKPYPSGGLGHTAIDAVLELRSQAPLDKIDKIVVAITKYAGRRYTSTYPVTVENAKFSGPYLAAYTLVHGAPLLAAFTEKAIDDEVVKALARKVELTTYDEHADVLEESPAKVTITLTDGRKLESAKYYPSGSVQVPMTPAQIESKFMTCAATAIAPNAATRLFSALNALDKQPALDPLWPLLAKRPANR